LRVITNGGDKMFVKVGVFKMFPLRIFYNEDSLMTILLFCNVAASPGVRVTVDIMHE